jgi:AcrR family transcriptional regulator
MLQCGKSARVSLAQRVEKRKPSTLRGQHTRQVLLQAAGEVFGRRGFGQASVGEITHRAGVATGTFYVHFENKEALFLALVEDLAQRLETFVGERAASHGQRLSRHRAVLAAYLEFVKQTPHLYRVVHQAYFVDEAVYRAYYERFARTYVKGLGEAMASGDVAKCTPEVLAYVLMGVADFVGMRFVVWADEAVASSVLDEVVAFVEAGLSPAR